MSLSLSLSLSGYRSGGSAITYDNTNAVTILSSSAITTTPTNNIDPNGYIAAVTFTGQATGQTLTPSKITLTYSEPGFDSSGNATTVQRTATGKAAMIMPVPAQWLTATVYAAGARVVNRSASTTRIYSTTAGGTSGATPPTHTTGSVSDGAVTWTYLSDCEQTTTNTATVPIEATSGSDAIVYVVLDRFITSGATNFTYAMQAGAYGSSTASNGNSSVITNNSTFAPLKPHVVAITPPWQLVGSGGSIAAEVSVTHPLGQNSRMAACVKFTVYDNSNAATSVTSTVTAMTQSSILTTTLGNPVPVFAASFTQAQLAAAGLADGMYSIGYDVFPFVGASYVSGTDGFGSTGTWSISTVMPGNNPKRIPFELDSDSSGAIYYAVVDGTGGGTPTASTSVATARANPFASINAAAAAIHTANGSSVSRAFIYIKGGTTLTGFGGSLDSGKTFGTVWLTIQKDPNDGGVATINADTVTAANRVCGKRTKFYDVTLAGSTTAVIDNVEAATAGVVAHEMWFDRCVITGNSSQQPFSRAGWMITTNCDMSGTATMTGNTRMAWHLIGGSQFSGGGVTTNFCSAVHALGNKFISKARLTSPTSRYWSENSQAVACQVFGFNTWYNCTQNVTPNLNCAGSNDGGTTGTTIALTQGASWVSNLIESNDAAAKGGEICADGVLTALPMLYDLFNTSAGDGQNICYNEQGTSQVKKLVIAKFNLFPDRNMKDGWYDDAANASQPARTGDYAGRFGVEWLCNIITSATNTTPSASNLAGVILESRSTLSGTIGFTSDRSKLGTAAGNGIYTVTTSSTAYSKIGSSEQMLPFDLAGTTRKTDGTGAAGAFEWA